MKCHFCDSSNFHRSRWQAHDVLALPFLLLPMRCYDCMRRQYRNLFVVLRARSAERRRRREEGLEVDTA
jgi:hypothetical protein